MEQIQIIDTLPDEVSKYGMCGYRNLKYEGYKNKIEWYRQRFEEGMAYKMLVSEEGKGIGGIEYIPGEYAWRPVKAEGYMFIHCLFVVPKKIKGQGYGSKLVKECIDDARAKGKKGVAVVTRKGTWMAGKDLFEKNGFISVDKYAPDYEIMVIKFDESCENPSFIRDNEKGLSKYSKGLYIFSSDQCPYTFKAVNEISEFAQSEYKIKAEIVEIKTAKQAQQMFSMFGIFCIVFNGEVVADHPISKTRFGNIMKKILLK